MKILRSPSQMLKWQSSLPRTSRLGRRGDLGFVPTMGALHAGHAALIKRSVQENSRTVVSIFVNPRQFGPQEDLNRYPHPFKKDLQLIRRLGVDALFYPTPASIYPPGYATSVFVKGLSNVLDGAPMSRGPGHFEGVATVVAKLFNAVRPTQAYFGLKDYQQVRVIEQLNQDLHFGIQIVRCPTVREKDGLAMSSRNAYLSPAERTMAPELYRALQWGSKLLRFPHKMTPSALLKKVRGALKSSAPQLKIEYIELVHPESLTKAQKAVPPLLLAAAVRLGKTRLIDNIQIP